MIFFKKRKNTEEILKEDLEEKNESKSSENSHAHKLLLQAFPLDSEVNTHITSVIDNNYNNNNNNKIKKAYLSDTSNLKFRKKILKIKENISLELYEKFAEILFKEMGVNRFNSETAINSIYNLIKKEKTNLIPQVLEILSNRNFQVAAFPNDREKELDLKVINAWDSGNQEEINLAEKKFSDYRKWAIKKKRTRFTNLALLKISEIIEMIEPRFLNLPIFDKWFNDWLRSITKFSKSFNLYDFKEVEDYIKKLDNETIKPTLLNNLLRTMTSEERRNLDVSELNTLDISQYKTEEIPKNLKQQYQEILYKAFPFSHKKVDSFFEDKEAEIMLLQLGTEILGGAGIIPQANGNLLLNWFAVNTKKSIHGVSIKSFFAYIFRQLENFSLECNIRPWVKNSSKPTIQEGFFARNFAGKGFGFKTDSYIHWERPSKESGRIFKTKPLSPTEEIQTINLINNSNNFTEINLDKKGSFLGIKMNIKGYDFHTDKTDERVYELLQEKFNAGFILSNILYAGDFCYFLVEDDSSGI